MGRAPGEATAALWVSDASIGKAARTPRGCRRGSKCQPGRCPATRIAASFAVPDDSRDRHAPAADLRRVAPRPHPAGTSGRGAGRSEEHTSELQSLMRNSYAVFCLKKKNIYNTTNIKLYTTHKNNHIMTRFIIIL